MKAVAYLRVSTDDQALGLEAQRTLVASYAAAHQLKVVAAERDEGVSGGSEMDAREGLARALGAIGAHKASVLLVAKRDRLARDTFIACTIERACAKLGAQVVCADGVGNGDDPASQFMRRILDAAAEYERGIIRARVKAALAVKKARGELTGSAPYGYRAVAAPSGVQRLVEDVDEMEARLTARAAMESGASLRMTCEVLKNHGHIPRSGGEWHPEQVRRMVARL